MPACTAADTQWHLRHDGSTAVRSGGCKCRFYKPAAPSPTSYSRSMPTLMWYTSTHEGTASELAVLGMYAQHI